MTGPEHFREAENLLSNAASSDQTTYEGENPEADRLIAAAQVHATLALAAATAQAAPTCAECDAQIPAGRRVYCSTRCRFADDDHGPDEPAGGDE